MQWVDSIMSRGDNKSIRQRVDSIMSRFDNRSIRQWIDSTMDIFAKEIHQRMIKIRSVYMSDEIGDGFFDGYATEKIVWSDNVITERKLYYGGVLLVQLHIPRSWHWIYSQHLPGINSFISSADWSDRERLNSSGNKSGWLTPGPTVWVVHLAE